MDFPHLKYARLHHTRMDALPSLRMMENRFIYMHHSWSNGLLHKPVHLKNEISTKFHNYTSSWIRLFLVDGWVNKQNLKPNFSSTVHIPRNMHHIKHPYQADWCNDLGRLSATQFYHLDYNHVECSLRVVFSLLLLYSSSKILHFTSHV